MSVSDETILAFIKSYINKHGYSPSIRDVANAVGIQSAGSMKYRLKRMKDSGLVTYDDGKPRTIRVVE